MGALIVPRLIAAGHKVTGWNRSRDKADPLAVTVTPAFSLEPVDGGVIQFNAPGAGASATLSATSAGVSGGQAAVTATADTTTGQYSVSAGAAGAGSTNFALANTELKRLVVPTTGDVVVPTTRDVVDQFDCHNSI